MKTKLGNGGYGPEEYSEKTGQYVEDGEPNSSYDNPEEDSGLDLSNAGEYEFLNDLDLSDAGEYAYLDEMDFDKETSKEDAEKITDTLLEKAFSEENKQSLLSLDSEDKMAVLQNSSMGYDSEKLANLSNEEVNMLVAIEKAVAIDSNINKLMSELELKKFDSAWKNEDYVTVIQYKDKQATIDKKIAYYQDTLGLLEYDYQKDHLQAKLDAVLAFKEAGEKYLNLLAKKQNLDNVKKEINFQDVISRYQDQKSDYCEYRKNNAVWVKGYSPKDAQLKSQVIFGDKAKEVWENASKKEKDAIYDYTGSYHKFNEPLRGFVYSGGKSFYGNANFREAIENMTNIIDKSSYDKDIWVQRGIGASTKLFRVNGSNKLMSLKEMSDSQLQSLVGTTFKENGFYSAGAAKETGFYDSEIILNTYCPKGTKMMYMNIHGQFESTKENEMILQRGYSFRITKVEKTDGQYYVDCEVLLDSNKDMPKGDALDAIWKKYSTNY